MTTRKTHTQLSESYLALILLLLLLLSELEKKITNLKNEIDALGGAKKIREKKQIVVVVYGRSKKKLELQISYVVMGASFTSSYDVRIKSETADTKSSKVTHLSHIQLTIHTTTQ